MGLLGRAQRLPPVSPLLLSGSDYCRRRALAIACAPALPDSRVTDARQLRNYTQRATIFYRDTIHQRQALARNEAGSAHSRLPVWQRFGIPDLVRSGPAGIHPARRTSPVACDNPPGKTKLIERS